MTFVQITKDWVGLPRIALIAAALIGIGCAGGATAQSKQVIARAVPSTVNLPFSEGIAVGNTLYVAGQQGEDEAGHLAKGGIQAETQGALDNIARVVKAAGFRMSDVVSVTVYLADIKEFDAMNTVYKRVMPDPKPTRATVQVAGMYNQARVEISAIAVKSP